MIRIIYGVSIALSIVWLVGQLLGVGAGFLWRRRRSRIAFLRRLRRNGLPEEVIEEIAEQYHAPGVLRDLLRSERS